MIREANYLAHGCYFPLPYKAGEQSHTLRASCKTIRFRSAVDTNSTQNRREKIPVQVRTSYPHHQHQRDYRATNDNGGSNPERIRHGALS